MGDFNLTDFEEPKPQYRHPAQPTYSQQQNVMMNDGYGIRRPVPGSVPGGPVPAFTSPGDGYSHPGSHPIHPGGNYPGHPNRMMLHGVAPTHGVPPIHQQHHHPMGHHMNRPVNRAVFHGAPHPLPRPTSSGVPNHVVNHHFRNVKQTAPTTGQRILSMPPNGNNKTAQNSASEASHDPTDKESSPEPEEFIELKSDLPTVERLDNSKMIRELKIGKKRRKELLEYDDRQRMLRLVDAFSDEQVNRYEMYRRSCFPRNQIKRLMTQTANCSMNSQVCIAMAGVAKVFVGEIVEEALRVAEGKNHEGALLPTHIREAVRRLGAVDGSHLNDGAKKSRRLF